MDQEPHFPTSTWDVFNKSAGPLRNVNSRSQPRPATETPSIDAEKVTLLKEYQNGVGTWVGLFDNDLHLTHTIVKRALESPLLLNAICAVTARQMSLVGRGETWKSIAVNYYGESLRHLIHTLDGPSYCSGDTLAATVLLSSYELFTSPGLDHHRHVSGAVTLIKSNLYNANSGGAATAAFWVYARQDVAMALVHECPTIPPPEQWGIPWTDQETAEDSLGNRMIWIVAKVIAHTFREVDDAAKQSLHRDRTGLIKELDTWQESLPTSFAGVSFGSRSEEGFLKRFFAVPSTGGFLFQPFKIFN